MAEGDIVSTTATVDAGHGIEAWCDYCGSVAWWGIELDDWYAPRKAAAAAVLHEDNDCAPIWLDDQGEPTTVNTGRWAGGCENLREFAAAEAARISSDRA